MRGEKFLTRTGYLKDEGSSPHARGKVTGEEGKGQYDRIIPACAGKSIHDLMNLLDFQDHPRMRGEKK